jgi:hypothetical protein
LPLPLSHGLPRINRLRFALALLVAALCAVGIGILAVEVTQQIDRQRSTGSDNVQWALDQADMELLHLALAVDDGMHPNPGLGSIRTRFDIFFSRVRTLRLGAVFAKMRANETFAAGLARMEDFVATTTPLIDGPDAALSAARP